MKIIIEPENGPAQVWSTEPAENRATLYENRAKDLEKRLAEETDRAEAWELRCGELEQDLRDAQDRIHEQNWLIAQYDDENGRLKAELDRRLIDVTVARTECDQALTEWAHCIHDIAVSHGWWESEDGKCDDGDRPFPEIVALCHSELSEALEEYRIGRPMAYIDPGFPHEYVEDPKIWPDNDKPEGIAVEMIDCIIRILDWMGHEGIDVDTLMEKKVKYNEGREHRHGGKKA